VFYDIFEALCHQKGISPNKACVEMGLSRSIAAKWKNTQTKPSADVLPKIADYFGVSTDYLLGTEQRKTALKDGSNVEILDERLVRFPIIGSISAGYGGLAVEEYTGDYSLIPLSDLRGAPDDYFVLRVSGDSMYPRLLDGDRVFVHKASTVENGKIAVVLFNGDEATVKKVNYNNGKFIELIPYNPEYKVKRIEGADLEQCHIVGEVIQLIRSL